MAEVVMYSTAACPYCERARRLLDARGVRYTEVRVDEVPARRTEMEERAGRTSVPQVFIGRHHVGGFDELSELALDDELERLLEGA